MNQLLILAYTVGGGAIGAALNQYVTNIGQRRTARATVVYKVSEIEAIYGQIRWPIDAFQDRELLNKLHLELEQNLHALEGAGLVAGIPRTIISPYILVCRTSDTIRQFRYAMSAIQHDMETYTIPKLAAFGNTEDLRAQIDELLQDCHDLVKQVELPEGLSNSTHDAALDALSTSLWHPIAARFRILRARRLRETSENIEKSRRDIFASARHMQVTKDQLVTFVGNLPIDLMGEQ